jgi:hypothetical protein
MSQMTAGGATIDLVLNDAGIAAGKRAAEAALADLAAKQEASAAKIEAAQARANQRASIVQQELAAKRLEVDGRTTDAQIARLYTRYNTQIQAAQSAAERTALAELRGIEKTQILKDAAAKEQASRTQRAAEQAAEARRLQEEQSRPQPNEFMESFKGLERVGRIAAIASASINAANVAGRAAQLVSAQQSGDLVRVANAYDEAKDAAQGFAQSIPLVGGFVAQLQGLVIRGGEGIFGSPTEALNQIKADERQREGPLSVRASASARIRQQQRETAASIAESQRGLVLAQTPEAMRQITAIDQDVQRQREAARQEAQDIQNRPVLTTAEQAKLQELSQQIVDAKAAVADIDAQIAKAQGNESQRWQLPIFAEQRDKAQAKVDNLTSARQGISDMQTQGEKAKAEATKAIQDNLARYEQAKAEERRQLEQQRAAQITAINADAARDRIAIADGESAARRQGIIDATRAEVSAATRAGDTEKAGAITQRGKAQLELFDQQTARANAEALISISDQVASQQLRNQQRVREAEERDIEARYAAARRQVEAEKPANMQAQLGKLSEGREAELEALRIARAQQATDREAQIVADGRSRRLAIEGRYNQAEIEQIREQTRLRAQTLRRQQDEAGARREERAGQQAEADATAAMTRSQTRTVAQINAETGAAALRLMKRDTEAALLEVKASFDQQIDDAERNGEKATANALRARREVAVAEAIDRTTPKASFAGLTEAWQRMAEQTARGRSLELTPDTSKVVRNARRGMVKPAEEEAAPKITPPTAPPVVDAGTAPPSAAPGATPPTVDAGKGGPQVEPAKPPTMPDAAQAAGAIERIGSAIVGAIERIAGGRDDGRSVDLLAQAVDLLKGIAAKPVGMGA